MVNTWSDLFALEAVSRKATGKIILSPLSISPPSSTLYVYRLFLPWILPPRSIKTLKRILHPALMNEMYRSIHSLGAEAITLRRLLVSQPFPFQYSYTTLQIRPKQLVASEWAQAQAELAQLRGEKAWGTGLFSSFHRLLNKHTAWNETFSLHHLWTRLEWACQSISISQPLLAVHPFIQCPIDLSILVVNGY